MHIRTINDENLVTLKFGKFVKSMLLYIVLFAKTSISCISNALLKKFASICYQHMHAYTYAYAHTRTHTDIIAKQITIYVCIPLPCM